MAKKVAVIGAGKVGATVAHLIALKGLADIVIINRTAGTAQGIALDIQESMPVEGLDVKVRGGSDYSAISASDIVIITAGAQRKEGMSRDELLRSNADIVSPIAAQIKKYAPESIVIVVTNPLDPMAYLVKQVTGFDRKKVIGMAGALDSARLSSFIAEELSVSVKDVKTMILGSHGDTMVAALSATTVKGEPIANVSGNDILPAIVERARNGGAEIIKLEQSSAYYAPASSVVSIVESIINDRKATIPCSAYLEGEYEISGIFIGVPVVLGSGGIERIVELNLSQSEKKALASSAAKIAEMISQLDKSAK